VRDQRSRLSAADQRFAFLLSRLRQFGILRAQFRQYDGADVLRASPDASISKIVSGAARFTSANGRPTFFRQAFEIRSRASPAPPNFRSCKTFASSSAI
jgi:hypothetical protein